MSPKRLSLIEGRWVWASTYEEWHSWTAPCFLMQVVFRGEGVQSHDATITICIIVFGLQNPTSLQFQNFTNLVSEKMFVQQTMFWSILHRAIIKLENLVHLCRDKSMEAGPALILLTAPVSKTLLWNYFQQPSCNLCLVVHETKHTSFFLDN